MSNVLFEDGSGIGKDVVRRAGNLLLQTHDVLFSSCRLFRHHQLQLIERHGDNGTEVFEKLKIGFVEGIGPRAFNVECSQDDIVQPQRNGE